MKIAVSQREIILENYTGESFVFDGIERSWYSFLNKHILIPVPNTITVDTDSFDFDCLLITGGPDSVARHFTENNLYKLFVEKNKPVVGVCHGAFVINDIEGGVNGRKDNHMSTQHQIYMEGTNYEVNSYHSQCIESITEDFEAVATDTDGTIEGFMHKQKPIYGIVWHPERQDNPVLPLVVRKLLQ